MDRVGYKFSDIKVKELPLFYHLTVDLSTLLDQDDALGNDFQRFLSLMGFCMPEIGFLESRYKRPTVEALKSWPGSTVELVRTLRKCEREDAVFCVRRWLGYLALLSRYERMRTFGSDIPSEFRETREPSRILTPPSQPSSFISGNIRDYTETDLPSIEQLLNEQYFPSNKRRRTASFLVIDDHDTSPIRKSSEYLCRKFTSLVKNCFLIPKDATWMTNSTAYINNFARVFCFTMIVVNLIDSIFSPRHYPDYWMELVISILPVMESIYVDKHIEPYKEIIRKVIICQERMTTLQSALTKKLLHRKDGTCSDCCFQKEVDISRKPSLNYGSCECVDIYNELQQEKKNYHSYFRQAIPKYSDLKLCVFCTLVAEATIIMLLLLDFVFCSTFASLHERLRNGFTSIAYGLLFLDCFYNGVVILCYYHDSTPQTVIRKDRFRQRIDVELEESHLRHRARTHPSEE
ncbi:uncharacterized protein [Apostichopus japonicus]|uniref:uncharacterized protein n=1 Tax=Stichopus japonicus TaxID=307972 RepID=UPI003AB8D638